MDVARRGIKFADKKKIVKSKAIQNVACCYIPSVIL